MRSTRTLPGTIAVLSGALLMGTASGALAAMVTQQQQAVQQSEGYSNSVMFNSGYGRYAGQENQAMRGSSRDANGNLLIVNGLMQRGGSVSQQDGLQQSGVGAGVNATAVGNSLNVTVTGAWNTVIVDSTQTNNGDQNATASLNGSLDF